MAEYPKPPKAEKIWATVGDKTPPPDDTKVAGGFIVEIPTIEQFNYIEWKQDAFIAHLNQRGFPEWDSVSSYLANRSYVQGSNGIVYKAKTDHSGIDPTTETGANSSTGGLNWKLAFYAADQVLTNSESYSLFLNKYSNLADLTNIASARANLGIYSTTETNNLYLSKTANLADLTSYSTAFNNIKQIATESYAGVLPIATDAVANAGVDNTVVVTPRKLRLGFSLNLATNGHIRFPQFLGGLTLQWGSQTVSANSASAAALSTPFTSSCFNGTVCLGATTFNDEDAPKCAPSGTNLFLYNGDAQAQLLRWFAVGY